MVERVWREGSGVRTSTLHLPRLATSYPGCYPLHFEKRVREILRTRNYIHLFAGTARTGVRVDTNPGVSPNTIADVHRLPFADNSFDGAMADPPYTKEFARDFYDCDYPRWDTWSNEMVRVVRKGGRIAVMHNYVVPRLPGCDFEEVIIILLRIKQYPKIVTVQKKRHELQTTARKPVTCTLNTWR